METFNFGDLNSLAQLKDKLKNDEPVSEGLVVTPGMLTSPVSAKLIKYFLNAYPEIIEKMKKDQSNSKFITDLEKTLNENGNLSTLSVYSLNDLYLNFLRRIPLTQEGSTGAVFNPIARAAGCTNQEMTEAKVLMDALIEPALNKYFNKGKEDNFSKN